MDSDYHISARVIMDHKMGIQWSCIIYCRQFFPETFADIYYKWGRQRTINKKAEENGWRFGSESTTPCVCFDVYPVTCGDGGIESRKNSPSLKKKRTNVAHTHTHERAIIGADNIVN